MYHGGFLVDLDGNSQISIQFGGCLSILDVSASSWILDVSSAPSP